MSEPAPPRDEQPQAGAARALLRRLRADGRRWVALLGTPDTLQGGAWIDALAAEGIEAIVPSAADRAALQGLAGRQGSQARAELGLILEALVDRGAEAVLVGRPELLALLPAGRWPLSPYAVDASAPLSPPGPRSPG